MNLRDRIFPKAKDFQNFAPPEGELPRKAFPFLWVFVKALRWSIGTSTLIFAIGVACNSLEPWFFGRLVDILSHTGKDAVWKATASIVIAYFLICQLLHRVCNRISALIDAYYKPVLVMVARKTLARYLFTHSYKYFQEDFAGRLAGKVIEMPQSINDAIGNTGTNIVWYSANATVSIVLFAGIGWQFALACILFFASSISLYIWRIPFVSLYAGKTAAANQTMRGRYVDAISNILLVKLFGREKHEDRLFSASMIEAAKAWQSDGFQGFWLWMGQEIINTIFQTAIVLLCIHGFQNGTVSVGQIATALALALSIGLNIWFLIIVAMGYVSNVANIKEALSTIIVPMEVQDVPAPKPFTLDTYGLNFDHITFAYPGRGVFDDFSLIIPQGQRVGLVGPSGAGKSTLVQLVLRLFDVQGGAIKIGGQDIASVAQNDLRTAIAMIPQATDLMHRSIRDNIAYGRLDASEDEIMEAAKKAYIHETILGLKDSAGNSGYDAMVGERGVKLSGGQRQRIAIARAFLKNAPILILDEATSALDSESERLIQQSLNDLFQGRTVLAIAHRLSTIAHLDRIVVMEDGRIVEDGPHAALVNGGGLYARLWQLQSEGFLGG